MHKMGAWSGNHAYFEKPAENPGSEATVNDLNY